MTTETVSIERTEDGIIQHERWTSTYESKTFTWVKARDGKVILSMGPKPEGEGFDLIKSAFETISEAFRPEDAEHLADILRKLAVEARETQALRG